MIGTSNPAAIMLLSGPSTLFIPAVFPSTCCSAAPYSIKLNSFGIHAVPRKRQGLLVEIIFYAPEQYCLSHSRIEPTGKTRETGLQSKTLYYLKRATSEGALKYDRNKQPCCYNAIVTVITDAVFNLLFRRR